MNGLPRSVWAITLFVADPVRSKAFYTEVFDAPVLFEDDASVAFKFDNMIVNLLADRAAPELIVPAPVASQASGSRFQLTITVDDVDAVFAQLKSVASANILNGPINRPWGMRTVAFADPDGHVWEIAAGIE